LKTAASASIAPTHRGVYETPHRGAILYFAHNYLETVCLDKYTAHKKQELAITFAELVYNGQWFTTLREALSAFVEKTQENVTGTVKIKLYKGNLIKAGVWSEHSLYSEEIATFGEDHVYNQADAAGFISLYGLPIRCRRRSTLKTSRKQLMWRKEKIWAEGSPKRWIRRPTISIPRSGLTA
jgi:argininosuccinate synthase